MPFEFLSEAANRIARERDATLETVWLAWLLEQAPRGHRAFDAPTRREYDYVV